MLLLKEVFSNFKILYIPLRGAKGLGNLFFGAFLHKQTQFLPKKKKNNYHSIQGAWNVCLQTTETMQM